MSDDGKAGPQEFEDEKRKALVIAVSDYDNLPPEKQLPFCTNDGNALCSVLKEQNYDIPDDRRLIGRVEGAKLRTAILDFFGRSARPDDTLVFYYSGHGIADSINDHYITSSDTEREFPEENGFNFEDLEKQWARSPARKIVAFLDCCMAGAISAEPGKGDEDAAQEARGKMDKVFEDSTGRCVLASSLDGQASYAMKGKEYSQFTYYLLEGLKGGNGEAVDEYGYVTPNSLGDYVFNHIEKQKPVIKTAQSGEIKIAEYPALATSTIEVTSGIDEKEIGLISEKAEIPSDLAELIKSPTSRENIQPPKWLSEAMSVSQEYLIDRILDNLSQIISNYLDVIQVTVTNDLSAEKISQRQECKDAITSMKREFTFELQPLSLDDVKPWVEFMPKLKGWGVTKLRFEYDAEPEVAAKVVKVALLNNHVSDVSIDSLSVSIEMSMCVNGILIKLGTLNRTLNIHHSFYETSPQAQPRSPESSYQATQPSAESSAVAAIPKVTYVEFYIVLGYRNLGNLNLLTAEIENQYSKLKAETGQTLNYECVKRPWETRVRISVEGYQETVRDFLQRVKLVADSLGLSIEGDPDYYSVFWAIQNTTTP